MARDTGPAEEVHDQPESEEDLALGMACEEAIDLIEKRIGKPLKNAVVAILVDEGAMQNRGALGMTPKDDIPGAIDFLLNNVTMLAQEVGGRVEVRRQTIPVERVEKRDLL